MTPNNPNRVVIPVQDPDDRLRESLRILPFMMTPTLFGLVSRNLIPGKPSFGVEYGVFLSAAMAGAAFIAIIARMRARSRAAKEAGGPSATGRSTDTPQAHDDRRMPTDVGTSAADTKL